MCGRYLVWPPSTGRPVTSGPHFDALVLAGGAATRLGGIDKMLVVVDGRRLIDHAMAAVEPARLTICVGSPRSGTSRARWTSETPPGGGPVAAIAAGLPLVTSPDVVLLAADLPFVRVGHVRRLVEALESSDGPAAPDGAMFIDPQGRDQPLLSAWRTTALRSVIPAEPAGLGLRRVLAPLVVRRLVGGDDLLDCDTPEDVASARRRRDGPDE
jgi:molybdopterin-guanine dinucleotide biosynthesis protein A